MITAAEHYLWFTLEKHSGQNAEVQWKNPKYREIHLNLGKGHSPSAKVWETGILLTLSPGRRHEMRDVDGLFA